MGRIIEDAISRSKWSSLSAPGRASVFLGPLKRLKGGRNNQIYFLNGRGKKRQPASRVVKLYFREALDPRDRLNTEFTSLQFLWKYGLRCIPRPQFADSHRGYAVYSYVEGRKITASEVGDSDVDQLLLLIKYLKRLSKMRGSKKFPDASEACFSAHALVKNIQRRFGRLYRLPKKDSLNWKLGCFLDEEFRPVFEAAIQSCQVKMTGWGESWTSPLSLKDRILSPSDYGFHNALRQKGGRIVFLDFEYFGWDDPAKMIADFLWHPAVPLRFGLKQRFFAGCVRLFEHPARLARRVEALYPLVGLKWCMILLNEFVPLDLARRSFAGAAGRNGNDIKMRQLSKTRQFLNQVIKDLSLFPYKTWKIG